MSLGIRRLAPIGSRHDVPRALQLLPARTARTAGMAATSIIAKTGMLSLAKKTRRAMKRITLPWRHAVIDRSPPWARRAFGPATKYADMLLVDHGIFRIAYLNRHRLGEKAWRSAQPAPHQIAGLAREGIRTIINLRGVRPCGSFWLEEAACARHGIRLVNFQMRSRAAPSPQEILAARELFKTVEYPVLLHCKSGADRAGLMSAIYRHAVDGEPIESARRELSLRFGHIRQADTGILDAFFDAYLADAAKQPIAFFDWVETVYDPEALKRAFQANRWANGLVNAILRRE